MRAIIGLCLISTLSACSLFLHVRQQDLDTWVGVPIEALDTHPLFFSMPMYRTVTNDGIEIRNYKNSINQAVCNNIFYIKDSKVIEYAPTGQCYTDATTQPRARYQRLKAQ